MTDNTVLENVYADLHKQDDRLDEVVAAMTHLKLEQERVRDLLMERTASISRVESGMSEMLTVFESWRGAMRVLEMIGKVAKPMGYIAIFISACIGGYVAFKQGLHRPV